MLIMSIRLESGSMADPYRQVMSLWACTSTTRLEHLGPEMATHDIVGAAHGQRDPTAPVSVAVYHQYFATMGVGLVLRIQPQGRTTWTQTNPYVFLSQK